MSWRIPDEAPWEGDPPRRQVTEAEYAATLPARMQEVADILNERFADVLPPGTRFEWTTAKEGDHQ